VIFIAPLLLSAASGARGEVFAFMALTYLVTYLGMGLANVLVMTIRATITPPELMGRMNAAMRMLLYGGGAAGGIAVGALASVIGLRAAFFTLGMVGAAAIIPMGLSPVAKLRALPNPGPPAA
jgi:MFS family permease